MTKDSTMRRRAVAVMLALMLAGGAAAAQDGSPAPASPVPTDAGEGAGPPRPNGLTTLPETLAGAAGSWDLALEGGMRRCVLTLSMETGPSGRAARFPAGCRRALPVMAGITGWLFASEGIRLVDRNARPVLAFAKSPDGMSLGATAENGERYNLVPLQIAAMQPPSAAPAAAAAQPTTVPAQAGASAPTPPAEGPADGPAPGLYALDRAAQKDVCRLELSGPAEIEKDKAAVRVLPDCRDSGITVFDPVSWRFANGHLTLKARRGHAVNLVSVGEGRWRRDPEIGVALVLRKVEP